MRAVVTVALLAAAVLAAIVGLTAFGLGMNRFVQPIAEETNRLTETNSRRRVDGNNQNLSTLCLNMRRETDEASKRAFAYLIITEADAIQRQNSITQANVECIAEARGL